jgi:hypothetical protein
MARSVAGRDYAGPGSCLRDGGREPSPTPGGTMDFCDALKALKDGGKVTGRQRLPGSSGDPWGIVPRGTIVLCFPHSL